MKQHLFFDLDHTIWDFDKNAEETLLELYDHHGLYNKGLSCANTFIATYTANNHKLWTEYHLGKISKEHLRMQRFRSTFLALGMDPEQIPAAFEDDYVRISPTKQRLFDGAYEVLEYLQSKYRLHIISNGFKTTTLTKMEVCDLNKYFTNVFISEDIGCNKPDPKIFKEALEIAGAGRAESVMIGDSLEADIYGAMGFGLEAIYFNPANQPVPEDVTHTISSLRELQKLF